jgi:hypothetical protein
VLSDLLAGAQRLLTPNLDLLGREHVRFHDLTRRWCAWDRDGEQSVAASECQNAFGVGWTLCEDAVQAGLPDTREIAGEFVIGPLRD